MKEKQSQNFYDNLKKHSPILSLLFVFPGSSLPILAERPPVAVGKSCILFSHLFLRILG